jgi:hypothetical protein
MRLRTDREKTGAAMIAGALTWAIPGLGHFVLGHRGLAVVFFVAISLTYWTGIALGGLLDSVNFRTNQWLALSAFGIGGYATPCAIYSQRLDRETLAKAGMPTRGTVRMDAETQRAYLEARAPYASFYPGSDVSQIYVAAAGLLNLLAILDAVSRALYDGLPTHHGHLHGEPAMGEGVAT